MGNMIAPPLIGIVDDDRSIREAMGCLIRSAGYRSAEFESAAAFLDYDDNNEMRCLVLDMHMPGLTGLELQHRLAAMNRSIPVIFVTAHPDSVRERALQRGAVGVLGKPFRDEELLQEVQSALQGSRQYT